MPPTRTGRREAPPSSSTPPGSAGADGPGALVRALARVHPGVRTVAAQIVDHAAAWRAHNAATLARTPAEVPLWLALGDSTAQGVGAAGVDGGWVAQLAAGLRGREPDADTAVPVPALVNLSTSGARLRDVLDDQLPRAAALGRPLALVTCTIGSNDLLRAVNPARTPAHARAVVRALGRLGATTTVVATVPHAPMSYQGRRLNAAIRDEAARCEVHVADVSGALRSWRGRPGPDHFHPNEAGYAVYAAAFRRALTTAGCVTP